MYRFFLFKVVALMIWIMRELPRYVPKEDLGELIDNRTENFSPGNRQKEYKKKNR